MYQSHFLFQEIYCRFMLLRGKLPRVGRRLFTSYAGQVPKKGDCVVVAMSGGVDSSVTARLLADQDYDLSAVFMRNWDTRDESGTDKGCEWERDWEDVQRVCRILDIPCRMVDLSREYWTRVFEPSLRVWESGGTPNPDIWCNKEVKFGALFDHLGIENPWVATGHYAWKDWRFCERTSMFRPRLLRSGDPTKDQNYYLSSISEQGLARALFPLGQMTKQQVRQVAAHAGLPTAEREESMGICFVGERRKFSNFLADYIPPNPGPIVDLSTGKQIAEHHGLWTFTIGQNARISGLKTRAFVARKSRENNTIYVISGPDHPQLSKSSIMAVNWSWIWANDPPPGLDSPEGFGARVQFRHRMHDVPCFIKRSGDSTIRINFVQDQKAIAEGQVAAVWDGEWCLGCGTIAFGDE